MNFIVWKKVISLLGRKGNDCLHMLFCWERKISETWRQPMPVFSPHVCPSHQRTLPSHLQCTSSGCSVSLPRLYSRQAISHYLCWLVERQTVEQMLSSRGPGCCVRHFSLFSGALIAYTQRACVSPLEVTNFVTQHQHCLSEPLRWSIGLHHTATRAVNLWRPAFGSCQILIAFHCRSIYAKHEGNFEWLNKNGSILKTGLLLCYCTHVFLLACWVLYWQNHLILTIVPKEPDCVLFVLMF